MPIIEPFVVLPTVTVQMSLYTLPDLPPTVMALHYCILYLDMDPDSKVHGANMGPIWGRQDPGGPHVGPTNFAIWGLSSQTRQHICICIYMYIICKQLHLLCLPCLWNLPGTMLSEYSFIWNIGAVTSEMPIKLKSNMYNRPVNIFPNFWHYIYSILYIYNIYYIYILHVH